MTVQAPVVGAGHAPSSHPYSTECREILGGGECETRMRVSLQNASREGGLNAVEFTISSERTILTHHWFNILTSLDLLMSFMTFTSFTSFSHLVASNPGPSSSGRPFGERLY